MIRKCYARMSDPASGNKLALEVLFSDGGLKIFICDFDKGVATLSASIKGKQFEYVLQGEMGGGHINLVRGNTIEHTIYVVNGCLRENGNADKSCALCEGQILIIECKKTFIKKPLRLDELTFE